MRALPSAHVRGEGCWGGALSDHKGARRGFEGRAAARELANPRIPRPRRVDAAPNLAACAFFEATLGGAQGAVESCPRGAPRWPTWTATPGEQAEVSARSKSASEPLFSSPPPIFLLPFSHATPRPSPCPVYHTPPSLCCTLHAALVKRPRPVTLGEFNL